MADVRAANEVQVRGRRNATPPVLLDQDTSELQVDASGNLLVAFSATASEYFIKGTANGETVDAVVRRVNAEPSLMVHDKVLRDTLDELVLITRSALEAGGIDFTNSGDDNQFKPGSLIYRSLSPLATTNVDVVIVGMANLNGYYIFNASASTKYVKLFNSKNAPNVGAEKPALVLPIPAGGAANVLDGLGILFSQGISIAITGGSADTDATAIAIGDVIVNLFYEPTLDAQGFTTYRVISAATTNADVIKTSEANLNGYYLFNTSGSTKYVKLYNLNRAPVVGTDKPQITLPLLAGSGANVIDEDGILFSQGLAIAITGALADSDTTAVALGDVIANIFYS